MSKRKNTASSKDEAPDTQPEALAAGVNPFLSGDEVGGLVDFGEGAGMVDFNAEAVDFDAEELPDPLANVEYQNNVEVDAKAEMSELLKAFKETARNVDRKKMATIDSEYWFCVCFQSREQKHAFLEALKWTQFGDKYVDGLEVAKALKIDLPLAENSFKLEREGMKEVPRIRQKKGGDLNA